LKITPYTNGGYTSEERDSFIKNYGYASTVAQEAIMRLLDEVTADEELALEDCIEYWTIIKDFAQHTQSQLEESLKEQTNAIN
jgi:hypothetical protein